MGEKPDISSILDMLNSSSFNMNNNSNSQVNSDSKNENCQSHQKEYNNVFFESHL